MIHPIKVYRFIRRYARDYNASKPFQVKVYNSMLPDNWLRKFILNREIIKINSKKTLSIFSVNGDRLAIDINRSNYKIFCTGENVHVNDTPWEKYNDLLLNKKTIDLSLGFDNIEHEKYLRFPFTIEYINLTTKLFYATDDIPDDELSWDVVVDIGTKIVGNKSQ